MGRIHIERRVRLLLALLVAIAVARAPAGAQAPTPIVYTLSAPHPGTHEAEVRAIVPTGGRESIEMMMPIWSPGY